MRDPQLENERQSLLGLGYRLTGSFADAEDVVQETYARWYAMTPEQRDAVRSPGAWLTTVASRISLDLLRSARARRERYTGQWLPEPVPGGLDGLAPASRDTSDPADRVTLDESLTMAFLVVLESMTPAERVAFVLHDVFRYPFDEIGQVLGRSSAASRQLASSARRRAREHRPDLDPPAGRTALVRRIKTAWENGDVRAIVDLLDPNAVAVSDGGGIVSAAPRPIEGVDAIARFFTAVVHAPGAPTIHERTVNGKPGLVVEQDGVPVTVVSFEFAGSRILRIWAMRNPDKLGAWRRG
jgi:RNA polymerase sigma-70 factor (ECF subfamily)